MEAGGGGGVLSAAREPRELQEQAEKGGAVAERKGSGSGAGGGGGMKFRVSARAPHGVGALLLVGGAAALGAAVVAWRRSRRARNHHQRDRRQLPKDEVLGGGVVEAEKGLALTQKLDQADETPSAEKADIGSGQLDGKPAEETHQKDHKNVADELKSEPAVEFDQSSEPAGKFDHSSEPAEKLDQNSVPAEKLDQNSEPVEKLDQNSEPVEKFDQNPSRKPDEITMHDMDGETAHIDPHDVDGSSEEKIDEDSNKDDFSDETATNDSEPAEKFDQTSSRISVEIPTHNVDSAVVQKIDENLIKSSIKKDIAPNDNEDVKTHEQSTLSITRSGIILTEHSDHHDGNQEAESMENTPTAQVLMQDQLLDDMITDTGTETAEPKLEETSTDESELEQDEKEAQRDEKKALAGLVELVSSPAVPSLVKPAEKKGPEFPRRNETGMKIEQDYTNGTLRREDGLISKGGMQGGTMATMDRRNPGFLALIFAIAMTIGIAVIVRLYAPARSTKLQMDLLQ